MKISQIFTLMLLLCFFSCKEKAKRVAAKNENDLPETQVLVSNPDTLKKLVVDDYPVTNGMLAGETNNKSSYKTQSGQTFSFDKAWFSNDTLKQVLVFELYTDYHRVETYHFYSNDVPADLIHNMEFHSNVCGEIASDIQKRKDFPGFLTQTRKISSVYFVSNKGFKLGDLKQKAIDIYGEPGKKSISQGIEKLEWSFIGDNFYDGKTDLNGKPLAKGSFGHQIVMYFRDGKLIGQILYNDIP